MLDPNDPNTMNLKSDRLEVLFLHDHANAMVELEGICSIHSFLDIFNVLSGQDGGISRCINPEIIMGHCHEQFLIRSSRISQNFGS